MLLNRHRVARLIELTELERHLTGPERLLREEDVALLVKAAYDDATEEARATFMERVKALPTSMWPWSAVRAAAARGARGGGVVAVPLPPTVPPALTLLRGQADAPDADPGNRIPDPGAPGSTEWDPLYKALDTWDTKTIQKWIGPQSWITPGGTAAGQVPKDTGTSGPPADQGAPTGGAGTSGTQPQPQPQPVPAFTWRHPAVIAAGATVATTVAFSLYAIRQARRHPAPLTGGEARAGVKTP